MNQRTTTKLCTLFILMLLISGCALLPNQYSLAGTSWRLVSYVDSLGNMRPVAPGSQVTAEFAAGQVGGSSGCNSYSGKYQVKGDRISFGALASTLMACEETLMQQESDFFSLMGQTAAFQTGAELRLFDAQRRLLAIFAPSQTPSVNQRGAPQDDEESPFQISSPQESTQTTPIIGVTWKWIEYYAAIGERLTPTDPEKYTLFFKPDGSITVHADCNMGTGGYSIDGERLSLRVGILTLATCGEGSLSAQFIGYLNQANSFSFEGQTLEIYLEAGSLKLAK